MVKPQMPSRTMTTPVIPTNSLVASAVRYSGKVPRIHNPHNQKWQTDCYRHYAICGEARAAARFFGRALSRAVLNVTRTTNGVATTVTDGSVADLLADLFNGKDGQQQMLEAIGMHLTIAGECYLIGRTVTEGDTDGNILSQGEVWEIVSVLEVKVAGDQWRITYGEGQQDIILGDDDTVIRIWQPNPANRLEADSPFRSLLPILTEIEWLTRHIFAQLSSRLAGAGILFLPQGMTFPDPPEQAGANQQAYNEASGFMRVLGDAMMKPLDDPSSPSALIPVIVTAPAESIDKARLMHFWSELDEASLGMRSEAIRRFAVGMDLPAEQILGMSSNDGTGGGTSNGVSHWGAWQIEESTIKMYIEPMLELVVNALTVSYIRVLEPEATDVITSDTSALRLRPDRSKEAIELWQNGAISTAVMLRENGFDVEDMPDADEVKLHFLRRIAAGSATPEQVEAALSKLGIELMSSRFTDQTEGQGETRETRPDPAPAPEQRPRTPERPDTAALLAACNGLVYRALERAGNRYINAGKRGKDKDKTLNPLTVHCAEPMGDEGAALLAGAFQYAPDLLDGVATDPDDITAHLERYVLDLFESGMPHSRERLALSLIDRGAA